MANYEIPLEILQKHNMCSLEDYLALGETEYTFYETFLIQTDYICNKIVEGEATWEDYADEKVARKFAREQLRTLLSVSQTDEEPTITIG